MPQLPSTPQPGLQPRLFPPSGITPPSNLPVIPPYGAPAPSTKPQTPATTPQPGVQQDKTSEAPKKGSAGDLFKGLMATDPAKKAISDFLDAQKRTWDKAPTGEKVAAGSAVAVIGAGAIAGILSDPAARKFALDQLNGQELPVPGVPSLKVKILTQSGGGAILQFDVMKALSGKK
jgi:hypothetical protein